MRYVFGLILSLSILAGLSATAASADFDVGWKAFVRGDFEVARKTFEPLAQSGHLQAQYVLGEIYRWGYGVQADPATAMGW